MRLRRHFTSADPVRCEEIELAILTSNLDVYYQPIIDLGTRALSGAEALVRWPATITGPLSASDLVARAEACGLVTQLDEWVLRTALDQLAGWQRQEIVPQSFSLSINASSLDFDSPSFPVRLAGAIESSGVDPSGVVIEVTESQTLANMEAARVSASTLHGIGMKLALDDFGSAYSNLARLQSLAFDVVKVDRCFTEACDTRIGLAFVNALVELAESLDVKVVAEGIETEAQADAMAAAGCDLGQGYLWAPAVPAASMGDLLEGLPLALGADLFLGAAPVVLS